MTNRTYKVTEQFVSLQGEGERTGRNTLWLRWFLCNLQCRGFGQTNPTDPSTYIDEYKLIDVTNISDVTQLPVLNYGCDSAYSWAKRFSHLYKDQTGMEIAKSLIELLKNPHNPDGLFTHPKSQQEIEMCFTGGEPMLNQNGMMDVINAFAELNNSPKYYTVETNGTRQISDEFSDFIFENITNFGRYSDRWFWSVSPKLYSTSGELRKRAIKPDVLRSYALANNYGQLKFVVNGTKETWDELDEVVELFKDSGMRWPVWIMPVGATKEQQELDTVAKIADEALARGYNVSGRLHCYIYGNVVGK